MGMPAARLTDMTVHGGTIMGPGCPTVLINKLPAIRVGDMHVCPMVTPGVPPIPHVGGPITGPGSPVVLIGKMPASVVGDMAVCVGPPSTVVLGSMDVFIGNAPCPGGGGGGGGGMAVPKASQAGSGGGGSSSSDDSSSNEDSSSDSSTTEESSNENDDTTDEAATEEESSSSKKITSVSWEVKRCWFGDEVKLIIETEGFDESANAIVQLWEKDSKSDDDFVHEDKITIDCKKVEFTWKAEFDVESVLDEEDGSEFEIYPVINIDDENISKKMTKVTLYVEVVEPAFGV